MTKDEQMRIAAECLSVFSQNAPFTTDQPTDDPVMQLGTKLEHQFTTGVMLLKAYPSEAIRKLATMAWDVIGNKLVRVAVGPSVPSMTFIAIKEAELFQAAIILPTNWLGMIQEDEVMQGGSLVYNCSKVVDFYNGIALSAPETIDARSVVYESEFLRTVKKARPNHTFNRYQQSVMTHYPEGVDDAKAAPYIYESKPFFLAQA